MATTDVTILNSQAGPDFEAALDQHVAWGLKLLDLKECIYGQSITDLDIDKAKRAADAIAERGLKVYCLSTSLFVDDLALGEQHFQRQSLAKIPGVLNTARCLNPVYIRLLAPQFHDVETTRRMDTVLIQTQWLIKQYDLAISEIAEAGYRCTIENETDSCITGGPNDALKLFSELSEIDSVDFTWDIQNMWSLGCFPSTTVYEALRPIIGYVHFKGGQSSEPFGSLTWRSSLEHASWPVEEIVRLIVRDSASPVICINPSHGAPKDDISEDYTEADIRYLRSIIEAGSNDLSERL